MVRAHPFVIIALTFNLTTAASATEPPVMPRMPVKEITVFKDGHALVLHEGKMTTDQSGNVVLDELPAPVIGTFWPYAADERVKLQTVTAGRKRVPAERPAVTLREIVQANIGTEAIVTDHTGVPYPATIVGFLTRDADDAGVPSSVNVPVSPPHTHDLILLKTAEATRVVQFDRIQEVRFPGKYQTKLTANDYRNVLTMKFDWAGGAAAKDVNVGMAYLQKGIRWIPNYRVEIDGNGKALIKLQATLLNEMTDLKDVTVNLVIGVPTFAFKDTVDPIALGRTLAGLSPYFDQGSLTTNRMSNAIMTQMARTGEHRHPGGEPAAQPGGDLGPDVAAGKDEDLFVYTLKNLTLKKGERLVVPVAQFNVEYKDIYVMDLPFVPPPEVRQPRDTHQQQELAKLFHAPKVMHKFRLNNSSSQPLTTAPALIVHNNRVLAQGMMTYTSPGANRSDDYHCRGHSGEKGRQGDEAYSQRRQLEQSQLSTHRIGRFNPPGQSSQNACRT